MRSSTWRSSLRQVQCHKRHRTDSGSVIHRSSSPARYACARCQTSTSLATRVQRRSYSTTPSSDQPPAKTTGVQERGLHRNIPKARKQSSAGIPPPPPLPDWFLQYNVRLQKEETGEDVQGKSRALLLLDAYNDAELLKIPFRQPVVVEKAPKPPLTQNFFQSKDIPGVKEAPEDGAAQQAAPTKDSEPEEKSAKDDASKDKLQPDADVKDPLSLPNLQWPLDAASWARLHGQLLVYAILKRTSQSSERSNLRNILVLSPNQQSQDELDRYVEDVSDLAHADLMRIDANDIAELAGDYIDSTNRGPGTISALAYDAYEGAKAWSGIAAAQPSSAPSTTSEGRSQDQPRDEIDPLSAENPFEGMHADEVIRATRKALQQVMNGQSVIGVTSVGLPLQSLTQHESSSRADEKADDDVEISQLHRFQQLKLKRFFNNLLDAPSLKKEAKVGEASDNFIRQKFADIRTQIRNPDMRRELHDASEETRERFIRDYGRKRLAMDGMRLQLVKHVHAKFGNEQPATAVVKEFDDGSANLASGASIGTILHIRDIHLILETPHGEEIIRTLTDAVTARQKAGHSVMILGTSAEYAGDVVTPLEAIEDEFEKRGNFMKVQYATRVGGESIPTAQATNSVPAGMAKMKLAVNVPLYPVQPDDRRLLELNLRHIQESISELGIECSPTLFGEVTRSFLFVPGMQNLSSQFLAAGEIQKIVLTAEGFRALYTTSPVLDMTHLAVASSIMHVLAALNDKEALATDFGVQYMSPREDNEEGSRSNTTRPSANPSRLKRKQTELNLDEMRRFATKHEQRLFSGIADPATIKTTYDDVHVATETVDSLKSVTTLALLRPEAFSYGVLARDRLPGLLLYGPPGTGKTLLAKAVAKDASARVLEISGAQVYEKYVGEGEKMVKAVFSLAKRLSPCVVFIDEADALFGSRGQSSNRVTHREIINQFLREWDGMDDHSVFIMVATNRPFDLDDAVLRRLPRRILVDLPTQKDRLAILRIHLKGEQLADDVSLEKLSEETPFYSGSDLKNVCVAAALAAVKEENEVLAAHKEDKDFRLPDRRQLTKAHFDKAIQEISASISEDMSSLNAIKKFDERYGDRRGRRKKTGYGFDAVEAKDDESAARVRGNQDQPRP